MNETEIISKVNQEYKASFNATQVKRNLFRNRLILLNNINRSEDKLNVNLIQTNINTLMALYYTDELQVEFMGRSIYTEEEGSNLNNMAKYDHDAMNISVTDYINQFNRFFYGVGVRIFTGWDVMNAVPKYKVVNPISCYPDPSGHSHINNFRFFSIDVNTTLQELLENEPEILNKDKLTQEIASTLESAKLSQNEQITQVRSKQTRDIIVGYDDGLENKLITINYHYTTYKGKPRLFINYGQTVLLLAKEITVTAGTDIKFPIALNYWNPIVNDPFGISVPDIIEDKQKNMQIYLNLMNIKATREALGGIHFVDRNVFQRSRQELLQPTIGPKYIPVDLQAGGRIQDYVTAMPNDPISPDVFQIPQMLEMQSQKELGIDNQTRGVAGGGATTATESQILQQNSNVLLALGNKVNAWGEKTFWQLWYLFYKKYFTDSDKKYVRLNKSIGPVGTFLKKKDFISGEDPDIMIANKSDIVAMNNKQKADFMAISSIMMQDPTLPDISKRFMKRKSRRLTGLPKEEIEILVPFTPDEINAKEQVISMINYNIVPPILDMNEDHQTYIAIYQSAQETPAKSTAINMRMQAYVQSGQQAQSQQAAQSGAMGGASNAAASQLVNSSIQNQNTPNTSQITGQTPPQTL